MIDFLTFANRTARAEGRLKGHAANVVKFACCRSAMTTPSELVEHLRSTHPAKLPSAFMVEKAYLDSTNADRAALETEIADLRAEAARLKAALRAPTAPAPRPPRSAAVPTEPGELAALVEQLRSEARGLREQLRKIATTDPAPAVSTD